MAVAVDAVSTAQSDSAANVTTATHTNLTVGASLSNGALVFALAFNSGGGVAPTSVALHWDSAGTNQAMTSLGSVSTGGGTPNVLYLFGLRNPTSGNKPLTATWTNSAQSTLFGISFTGVDQSSDANAFQHLTTAGPTASAAPSISVTSAVGNITLAIVSNLNGVTDISSWATGGTNLYLETGGTNNANSALMRAAGAASVTMSGALSASDTWVCNGVDVSASGAADVLAALPQLRMM